MQQLIISLIASLFFLWLLPLGVFIKPSLEKIACDGQRAVCLCHAQIDKAHSNNSAKSALTQNSGGNKEAAHSGGGANQFLICISYDNVDERISKHFESPQHIPSLLFVQNIEHVPKA